RRTVARGVARARAARDRAGRSYRLALPEPADARRTRAARDPGRGDPRAVGRPRDPDAAGAVLGAEGRVRRHRRREGGGPRARLLQAARPLDTCEPRPLERGTD